MSKRKNKCCARCEIKIFDPYIDDKADKKWDDPEWCVQGSVPYSNLCQGCASIHISDDEKFL